MINHYTASGECAQSLESVQTNGTTNHLRIWLHEPQVYISFSVFILSIYMINSALLIESFDLSR